MPRLAKIVAFGTAKQLCLSILLLTMISSGPDTRAHSIVTPISLHDSAVKDEFVNVDGLRVHYIESGTGRTVVMIHGNAGSVEDFENGVVNLLSFDYRVVAIDRPGHGKSDRPARNSAVEFQAQLLHSTLAKLGITQPILVGHSWGAALALAYALKYPGEVSAMVLLAPAAYPDDSGGGLLPLAVRIPVIGDLSVLLGKSMLGQHMLRAGLDRAFYPQHPSDRYFRNTSSLWLGRKQLKAYIEDEASINNSLKKMSRRYQDIEVPVVIVTGDKDRILSPDQNARALHAAIPNSRLIELKDMGHEIPQTHPEIIATALQMISDTAKCTVSTISR